MNEFLLTVCNNAIGILHLIFYTNEQIFCINLKIMINLTNITEVNKPDLYRIIYYIFSTEYACLQNSN